MVYGDLASIWGKNTSYFHKVANHKAKTNFMHGILDAQNHLQYDYQKMGDIFLDFYHHLFSSERGYMVAEIFNALKKCVPQMTQRALNLDFIRDKVEATLQSMAPTKSLDDSLLFCDAEPLQVTELKRIFRIYEEASG
ncbi:PREDICTED: non-ltr retroelement reverse mRNAase [Prunus dulcis]|uniref:PREDICTED: non-ltr retroelement reverse mRNAase n=1 Tax=Prunus dulcis TaxID=3755 RepID=A0A5E4G5D1_PRUDU|nr:PREDICTED: non-ltr retroelement reverse mRNAase [Prunus dulcis]